MSKAIIQLESAPHKKKSKTASKSNSSKRSDHKHDYEIWPLFFYSLFKCAKNIIRYRKSGTSKHLVALVYNRANNNAGVL